MCRYKRALSASFQSFFRGSAGAGNISEEFSCNRTATMITTALREPKPPPTPKFKPKVIRDANPNFRINPNPDVRRIRPKVLWMHYLVGISHFAKALWYKSAVDCTRNANKCPKNPLFRNVEENEKAIRNPHASRGSPLAHVTLLEGHPLPMSAKSGRRPFPRSSVILFTE